MLLPLVAPAAAQAVPTLVWEPVVELRQRLNLLDNGSGDDVAREIALRARLGIEVRRTVVSARVSFQELREWSGAASGLVSQGGFTPTIAEGWARVEGTLTGNIGAEITVGRQPIRVNEGRIVGEDNFRLEGQFFDAVRIVGTALPFSIEYVNARRFLTEGEDPLGFGVNVLRAGAQGENPMTAWVIDGLWVVDARKTAATTSTTGAYVRFDTGRFRGRAEGYLQVSAAGTGSLMGLHGGWVVGRNERLVVHLRYDGISGDSIPGGTADGRAAWQPVLGDSHSFGGLMERFAEPEDSGGQGLAHAQLALDSRPAPQLHGTFVVHRFWSPLADVGLGTEVDATATWAFSPFAAVRVGSAWFEPDPSFSLSTAPAPARRLYGYLELDVSF